MAGAYSPPPMDFSSLANLPEAYWKGQEQGRERKLREALAGGLPRTSDGQIDYAAAADLAARSGDLGMARTMAASGQTQALQRASIENMQGQRRLQERGVALQEKQAAEKPQYQTIEAPDGSKRLVKIDPYGQGVSDVTPKELGSGGGNPFTYGGKTTESQAKDITYANRIFDAERTLRNPKIVEAATSLGERAKGGVQNIWGLGWTSNFLTSPEYQQYDQAQRDFVNAVLRRESGAVISEAEFENARKQYFPAPGDSPERIAQKQRNRQNTIAGIAGGGGQAYKPPFTFGQGGEMIPSGAQKQGVAAPRPQAGGDPLSQARDAIARGAPRDAVIQRLQQNGIDPAGL